MPRFVSKGQCTLCGETFSKTVITRHLAKCRAEHPLRKKGRPRQTFHLRVEGQYLPEYWMNVEVPAAATLMLLDAFLRDIWLECCGHLSAFTIGAARYELDTGGVDAMWPEIFGRWEPPQSMNTRMDAVLRPGLKFFHEYDFGTTTHLALRVIAGQETVLSKDSVHILARNHPLPIVCEKCKSPAAWVCAQCIYEGRGWVCAAHAPKHKCGEEMLLPVVNSPRVGMCGYTGPMA
jgi:hypothetical protein